MESHEPAPGTAEAGHQPHGIAGALGWVLLAFVVLVIVGAQTSSYFREGGKQGESVTWSAEATQAEVALWMSEFAQRSDAATATKVRKDLAEAWAKRADDASKSSEGAATWVPIAHELGLDVPDNVLEKLAPKGKEGDAALYSLYSGRSGEEVARQLAKPDGGFARRLAAYHAARGAGEERSLGSVFDTGRIVALVLVFGGFVIALALGGLLLLVFAVQAKKLRQVGYPESGVGRATADRLALKMGVYLIAYFGGVVGFLANVPIPAPPMVKAMVGMSLFFFVLMAIVAMPVQGVRDALRTLVGRVDRPWRLVAAGLWAWLAALPVVLGTALVTTRLFPGLPTPSHPTTVDIAAGSGLLEVFATYAVAAVLAPLLEELTFRGMLFPALQRWMPWGVAAVVGGLVFGAVHPQGPLLWLSLGAIGTASAVVAQYTGSLVPSFVLHAANNAAVLTLALVVFG